MLLMLDDVDLGGSPEVAWAKGKGAGKAAVKLKVKRELTNVVDAETISQVCPGALEVFERGRAPEDATEDDPGVEPVPGKAQRVSFADELLWRLTADPQPDLGPAIEFSAPLQAVTVTASQGTVVVTVSTKFELPVSELPRLIALEGGDVKLRGSSRQESLAFNVSAGG